MIQHAHSAPFLAPSASRARHNTDHSNGDPSPPLTTKSTPCSAATVLAKGLAKTRPAAPALVGLGTGAAAGKGGEGAEMGGGGEAAGAASWEGGGADDAASPSGGW